MEQNLTSKAKERLHENIWEFISTKFGDNVTDRTVIGSKGGWKLSTVFKL